MTDTNTKTLRTTVADQIKAISPAVADLVVNTLVASETQKRADAVIKGLDKLTELEREGYKLAKGSVVTFNEDGSEASRTFTKEQLEAKKKNTEQVEKLTRALDKAITKGDMGDLYGLAK